MAFFNFVMPLFIMLTSYSLMEQKLAKSGRLQVRHYNTQDVNQPPLQGQPASVPGSKGQPEGQCSQPTFHSYQGPKTQHPTTGLVYDIVQLLQGV